MCLSLPSSPPCICVHCTDVLASPGYESFGQTEQGCREVVFAALLHPVVVPHIMATCLETLGHATVP